MSRFPIGAIVPHGDDAVPIGWLECNGASLLRADYALLYAIIANAWGTADGTHFNLPDLRGRFIRGWDHAVARDPDRASRTACNTGGETGDKVGTVQTEQYYSHTHDAMKRVSYQTVVGLASYEAYTGMNLGLSGGAETRPENAGAMYIIRYM